MPDLDLLLTDAQCAELRAAAERAGMSVELFARTAVSKSIARRYLLPKMTGSLLAFQGLKRAEGEGK